MSSLCTPPPPGAERVEGLHAAERAAQLLGEAEEASGPAIEALDLSENALGVHGAAVLSASLSRGSSLVYLSLFACELTDVGCGIVARALSGDTSRGASLRKLNLQCNALTDASCDSIAAMITTQRGQALTTLYLGENYIGPSGAQKLSNAIGISPSFSSLELAGNEHPPTGEVRAGQTEYNVASVRLDALNNIAITHKLAGLLCAGGALKRLNLSGNALGDEGVGALAQFVTDSGSDCNLTSLNLYDNCIGPAGIATLARALVKNRSIRHLNLMHNPVGDQGAESIAAALERNAASGIQDLNLCHCDIGPSGASAFLPVMRSSPTLSMLDLDDNRFCVDGKHKELIDKLLDAWMSGPVPRSRFALKTETSWISHLREQMGTVFE